MSKCPIKYVVSILSRLKIIRCCQARFEICYKDKYEGDKSCYSLLQNKNSVKVGHLGGRKSVGKKLYSS